METDIVQILLPLITSNPYVAGVVAGLLVLKGVEKGLPNHPIGKAAGGIFGFITSPVVAAKLVGAMAKGLVVKKPVQPETEPIVKEEEVK